MVLGFFSVQDGFFCRVRDILLHKNFSKLMDEEKSLEEEKKLEKNEGLEKIERNLKQYLHHRNVRIFTEGSTAHRAAVLSLCLLFR